MFNLNMILSDGSIRKLVKKSELISEFFEDDAIQSASYDCTLGDTFLIPEINIHKGHIDVGDKQEYRKVTKKDIIIPPHSFLLATTREYLKLPSNVCGMVEGKSSVGRLGLFIQNAGWINPGFNGKITLELYNANSLPIKIKSGMRICQMIFMFLDKEPEKKYAGKIQFQKDVCGSLIYQEIEVMKIKKTKS